MKRDENGVFVQAIRKKKERKKENPLRRKPGGHFKALHLLWVFFPPGRWRAEENHYMRERRREETSTPVLVPGAPPLLQSQSLHPPGEGVAKEETKGGVKGRGRKRLRGRFTCLS